MLDTGLPLEEVKTVLCSVSPPNSHDASRSSTPGLYPLDGAPSRLPPPDLLPRPSSCPPGVDMAVKPLVFPEDVRRVPMTKTRRPRRHADVAEDRRLEEPEQEPVPCSPVLAVPVSPPYVPVPDIIQVARLLQFQGHQSHRCHRLKEQLHKLQIATARTSRLAHIARSAQHTLAECIRSEDQNSFTNLFNALHDAARIPTEIAEDCLRPDGQLPPDSGGLVSFFHELPEPSRATVLSILTQIRRSGDFIAKRLAALTHQELLALLPDRSASRPSESILTPSGNYMRASRYLGYVVDGQTELVAQQRFGSPLEVLAFGVRGLNEATKAVPCVDVWSVVCSRLLQSQVPGSEKFVPALLDLCAQGDRWPGKNRLGVWILETLQRGAFLLETPSKQSFRARIEVRPAPSEEEMRVEAFYSGAVSGLLDLLGSESGPSVIPEAVLRMCNAIWGTMPSRSGHQRGFARFVLTRWLFSPFFFDAITLPEGNDMLLDHYISENARSRILREIASRAQKAIFDVVYAWKLGSSVPQDTIARVDKIAARFQGNLAQPRNGTVQSFTPARPCGESAILAFSAADVRTMLRTLFPQRKAISVASEMDFAHTGLQSSASSMSGFSLFRTGEPIPAAMAGLQREDDSRRQSDLLSSDEVGNSVDSTTSARQDLSEVVPPYDQAVVAEACNSLDDLLNLSAQNRNHWAVLEVDLSTDEVLEIQDMRSVPSHEPPTSEYYQYGSGTAAAMSSIIGLALANVAQLPSHRCSTLRDIYEALLDVMEREANGAQDDRDFLCAHQWFERARSFQSWLGMGSELDPLRVALVQMESEAHLRLAADELTADACELDLQKVWAVLDSITEVLADRTQSARQLRSKMWYVAEVRTSSAYDQARSIAGALRIMGKPKRPTRTRIAPPLRHWSASRITSTNLHLKSEAQILELLSTSPEQGGPNKLNDEQAYFVEEWLTKNRIENLCEGEERLHRLCIEIRKCVDDLTKDSAFLQSSPLFETESFTVRSATSPGSLSVLHSTNGRVKPLTLQTHNAPSIESMSSAAYPLSSTSSRDLAGSRSPTLTHRSSAPFWSPAVTDAQSPSSATSVASYHTHTKFGHPSAKRAVTETARSNGRLDDLTQALTSLLLSDLTAVLFSDGSETDLSYWSGTGGKLVANHLSELSSSQSDRRFVDPLDHELSPPERSMSFDWDNTFDTLLKCFAVTASPFAKLKILHQVDQLLPLFSRAQSGRQNAHRSGNGVRTALATLPTSQEDDHISGFRKLFCIARFRPAAVFRDLQYIAALVPADILENTPMGKSFCNAAVAITSLKHQARTVLVETADSIIAYNTNKRGHGRSSSTAQQQRDSATFSAPSRTPSAEEVSKYSMADAAEFLQIAAKEGDSVAQRELATLYLTHPDLMDHVIAPFARPREVFKEELEGKWKRQQDPYKCDPTTMCVAHHWMSLSSKGGDALAKEYLRAREEMERLP